MTRKYDFYVNGERFAVEVEEVGGPVIAAPAPVAAAAAPAPKTAAPAKKAAPAPVDGTAVTAPMPGLIVSIEKNVGDDVEAGDTVVILEAMKMENALTAPAAGVVKAVNYESGDNVGKGDVLVVID